MAEEPPASHVSAQDASPQAIQAQRLMTRLHDNDESLSRLLTQAADSLEAISEKQHSTEETDQNDLSAFEDVSQDWLANVYDVQLTLRKAIRFLVRSNHPPILTASDSFVHGGGVTAAEAGSAMRPAVPKEESEDDKVIKEMEAAANGQDAPLSMSALKLKHQTWKHMLESLQKLEQEKQASSEQQHEGPSTTP
ncbi:unnamed protein product [Sympodiomycopsis kandeliae]